MEVNMLRYLILLEMIVLNFEVQQPEMELHSITTMILL